MPILKPLATWLTAGAAVLLLQNCRPSENEFVRDFDVVFTTYDVNFSFESRNTYSLPDTVVIFGPGANDAAAHRFDAFILEALERYMYQLGWERVEPGEGITADLTMVAMISTQDFASCFVPCWNCGWGVGWGFPPAMSCSSFSTGSLYVIMTDPNYTNEIAQEIPVVWNGIINGLLSGSDENIARRLQDNISQMFLQSPYLKKQP